MRANRNIGHGHRKNRVDVKQTHTIPPDGHREVCECTYFCNISTILSNTHQIRLFIKRNAVDFLRYVYTRRLFSTYSVIQIKPLNGATYEITNKDYD